MKKSRLDLLHQVLSQPTAPFREGHVLRVFEAAFRSGGVPHFRDRVGNLLVGAASEREARALAAKTGGAKGRAGGEPLRLFVAHADHPGFHGAHWASDTALQVAWHGGSPTKHLEGARVWLASETGSQGSGSLTHAQMQPSGRAIASGTVRVDAGLKAKFPDPRLLFGGFGFRATHWIEGKLLYTKAADDLVGCFAIACLALDLWSAGRKPGKPAPFLGLLTRAEEVGFIGAIGHLELGWWKNAKRPLLGVSLETSRALPGAEIGKGPVVRLGDRATVFDSRALAVFTQLARDTLQERHQRRIMDGGSCEATAMTAYGIPCVGISVPLGNYHNQSLEGGPDSSPQDGPAPEFVHLDDIDGQIALCEALLKPKLPWDTVWKTKTAEFKGQLKKYAPLLKSGFAG